MAKQNGHKVYMIGIGGIGMSALARYYRMKGCAVSGYDRYPTPLTAEMEKEGIRVHFDEDAGLVPDAPDLVVYTPAVSQDHRELLHCREKGYRVIKRAEALKEITENMFTIAVAGTHGKTTISTAIAHILKSSEYDCTAFLGGISRNYQANFMAGKNDVAVVEADEFDRSFLQLRPDIAVISTVEPDHLDIYGTGENLRSAFSGFAGCIKPGGRAVVHRSSAWSVRDAAGLHSVTYALDGKADYTAANISVVSGSGTGPRFMFDLLGLKETMKGVRILTPGEHNIENLLAAAAVAGLLGIEPKRIRTALETFTGNRRRFEYHLRYGSVVYIDDYAHHPGEIRAAIGTVRRLYPAKKLTVAFQPHLYSRTRDLAEGFAESLSLCDSLVLLPVYPARELPIEGVNSETILGRVRISDKTLCEKNTLPGLLAHKELQVLMTLGAGDIDQLCIPIRDMLRENYPVISALQVSRLKKIFDGEILLNEPMSRHTTLRIGGPADVLLKPSGKEGVLAAVRFMDEEQIPYLVVGRGSNLLVGDRGIRSVVIAMKEGLDYLVFEEGLVRAGAAYDWPRLTLETIKAGYEGLEATAGIPATVGGAVAMNAGAYGTEVFDHLVEVEVIRNGQVLRLQKEEIDYRYRYTNLSGDIILEAVFRLKRAADKEAVLQKRKELLDKRNAAQPLNKPCVGSVFKNPEGDFSGRLIEACALKGFSVGGCQVSPKHANFFVNTGDGTAVDMKKLIDTVKKKVMDKFGVNLETEVRMTGEGFEA